VSGTGGASGTGGGSGFWTYDGRPVTKVDIQRCPPYYGCDVCTFTVVGAADAGMPNYLTLPTLTCFQPPVDGGTGASSSGGDLVDPAPCGIGAPDGGVAPMTTELILQPDTNPPFSQNGYPSAYCQFLPGPAIASPNGCSFYLSNEFCVSNCASCP
jgi:hypothetical protein